MGTSNNILTVTAQTVIIVTKTKRFQCIVLILQLFVSVGIFGWLEELTILAVWRFALVRPGALSAITCGQLLMLMWYADSWDSPDTVSLLFKYVAHNKLCCVLYR